MRRKGCQEANVSAVFSGDARPESTIGLGAYAGGSWAISLASQGVKGEPAGNVHGF